MNDLILFHCMYFLILMKKSRANTIWVLSGGNTSITKLRKLNNNDYFYMRLIGSITAIFILSLLLPGCDHASQTPEPRVADRSFLTGQPCKAPCWYNLELDKSTLVDVTQTLKELPFVDHNSMIVHNTVYTGNIITTQINFNCFDPKGEPCGFIKVLDDKLKMVNIVIRYPLSMKTVVDQIGPPEYIFFFATMGGGCVLDFDYEMTKGIIVSSGQPGQMCQDLRNGKILDKNLNFTEVTYLSKDLIPSNRCQGNICFAWKDIK
jgi:hypothetical protein